MSKAEIKNPLSKSMFKVFLTQYIQIHFFKPEKDKKESLENLKNLFFPPETTEEVFNALITFVTKLMDKIIKTEKELEEVFGFVLIEGVGQHFFRPIDVFVQTRGRAEIRDAGSGRHTGTGEKDDSFCAVERFL